MDTNPQILIVEGDRAFALEMRHALELEGYDVPAIVSSGEDAIRQAEELRLDLILINPVLKGKINGVEATGLIRFYFGIPVVYVIDDEGGSGFKDIDCAHSFGCVFKPFRDVELQAAVKVALYRHETEKGLHESEERYRAIIEGMEDGYYEVDLAGRFTFFNQAICRLTGIPEEELMGVSNLDYTTPETAKRLYETFKEVYRTGESATVQDYEIVRKDGSKRILEFNASLIKDNKGQPVGFRGISRDATARKQAEEEIRAHREHLALINQILRHDLTNDLLVAQSALGLYGRSPEKNLLEEVSGRVKKSLDLIDRMRGLEFFLFSHRELRPYAIRDVIREVAGGYPSVHIAIKGKARVMADDALFSVMDNIIHNAVVHGKADRIEVTIGRREDMCEVRIADNGSGIADEIKEAIFEEGFVYGDVGHTGLGLSMVRKVMKRYGGYIYVQDNEPKGAVFTLRFKMVA
jgi:PAS domain S-box-containing protein